MDRDVVDGLTQHKTDQCNDVQISERLRQSLAIAHQSAKARRPREGSLNHPSARQQYEATLGLSQLDHLQLDPMRAGRCCGSPPV